MYNVHVCQGARAGRLYCPVSDELFGRHVDDVPGSAVPVTSFVRCKATGCQQTDDAVVSRKTWSGSVSSDGDTHDLAIQALATAARLPQAWSRRASFLRCQQLSIGLPFSVATRGGSPDGRTVPVGHAMEAPSMLDGKGRVSTSM